MVDLKTKKIAVLVDNHFEQAEFDYPVRVLKAAGAEVTVLGASTKHLQALRHTEPGQPYTADMLLKDAKDTDYDALVLPGGAVNADKLRMDDLARTWVKEFLSAEKPVAVICHAPWVLVSAGVIRDRTVTSYYTIQDDIRNAGGKWVDQEVVIDGSLITSRKPDDLPAFTEAIISKLAPVAKLLQ